MANRLTAVLTWKDKMVFETEAGGNKTMMDAKSPIGQGSAMTPKELLLSGLGGCTAMDVVALLRKHKQLPESLNVSVEATPTATSHPTTFTKAEIVFDVRGPVTKETLLESVKLSQTKYCGVSAMLAKAFPIQYRVMLNGEEVGSGFSSFDI